MKHLNYKQKRNNELIKVSKYRTNIYLLGSYVQCPFIFFAYGTYILLLECFQSCLLFLQKLFTGIPVANFLIGECLSVSHELQQVVKGTVYDVAMLSIIMPAKSFLQDAEIHNMCQIIN